MAGDLMNTPQAGATVKPISKLDSAADLSRKFDQLKRGREIRERQWRLNMAFYKGRQYTYYSKVLKRLMSLPVEDGDKPRYRVRIVSNQIVPGCMSLLSKFLKTKPHMMATPGSGSDADLRAAEMAERLLEYWWDDHKLDDSLEEALLWSLIGGQGYWKIWWDAGAGKAMTFTTDPQGNPIMDDNLKTLFEAQLKQVGQDISQFQQTVYMGDICVEVISPFDLYVDPTVKQFRDAKYAIQVLYLDPEEIKARYPKAADVQADSMPGVADAVIPNGAMDRERDRMVKKMFVGYFRPSPIMPRGRIVTWIDNQILEDKDWDLPATTLPFVKFPGLRVPGDIYDDAVVSHAIPLQKELNRTLSQIVEFKNLGVKPQWKAPAGSLRQRRTDEPGAIYEYNPINGLGPEPIEVPTLPAYVFQHLSDIKLRIDELFGRTEVAEGSVPPNVEAGVAIDLLQEMATDRLAPQIRLIEIALEEAGRQMLGLGKVYYSEPRLMKIKGAQGTTQVEEFSKADIQGNVDVEVEAGSGLPRTRAGRQARLEFFITQGIIQPEQAWRYVDMADLHGISDQFSADEDQAFREQEFLDTGQPLYPMNMQPAQAAIQQAQQSGVDPDTGQPFQSPDEFQQWAQQQIHQATVQGLVSDNHQIHMDVHSRVMKSYAFRALPPDVQQAYIDHYDYHRSTYYSMLLPQREAVKTTMQLRGAVTPDEVSAILGTSAGVQITPEQASEPPTETWVTKQDPAGFNSDGSAQQNADPLLHELLAATVESTKADAASSVAHATAASGVVGQQQAALHASDQHGMKQSHAQELHAQTLRHAEEMHQAKLKQANKPPTAGKGK